MAMSLNRVQLIGNLTRDPEMRQIPGGQTVANFSIATNFVWTDNAGQKQEKAEYHNLVAWRKLAEIAGQFLKKGSKVFVEGRLQTRDWEGEDGVKRYKTEIVVDNLIMLDRKGGMGGGDEMMGGSSYRQAGGYNKRSSNQEAPQDSTMANEAVMSGSGNADEVAIDDLPF